MKEVERQVFAMKNSLLCQAASLSETSGDLSAYGGFVKPIDYDFGLVVGDR